MTEPKKPDHAVLSPSSAHEWLSCALSVKMRKLYKHLDPNRYSEANAQGTIKHAVIEQCLIDDVDPYGYVGTSFRLGDFREGDEDMPQEWADYRYEFTEDDADTMMYALEEIDTYRGEMHIEHRVDLSEFCGKDQFGTLDLGMVVPLGDGWVDVLIWDNKFGRVAVEAVENVQLMLYALGFWANIVRPQKVRIRKFIIRIWQPYVQGGGGEWECTLADLKAFAKEVVPAAKRALADDPKANPGPVQCEYCIGGKTMKCDAYVEHNKSILKSMFSEGEDLDTLVETDEIPCLKFSGVDPKTRSWITRNFDMFKRFVERLDSEQFEDAYYGRPVPGKRLAYGNRPRRKYRDQEEAEKRLVEDFGPAAYTKKVISVAQLEKKVGKKKIDQYDDLIEKGEPKLVLVDENDSRPRVKSIRDMLNED